MLSVNPVERVAAHLHAFPANALASHSGKLSFRRALHKGEHLYRISDSVTSVYQVRAGVLKCYRLNEEGEEQVIGFHLAGDICGFDGLAGRMATCNVMALDSSSLDVFPLSQLLDTHATTSRLYAGMMQEMSRELQRLVHMLQLERCTAEQRVASFLLEHSRYERRRGCIGTDFLLPVPRRDLARYLHLATETLSRVFGRLHEAGLLDVNRNHIVLKDLVALQARADHGAQERHEPLCA